jgi:hypothetical protein
MSALSQTRRAIAHQLRRLLLKPLRGKGNGLVAREGVHLTLILRSRQLAHALLGSPLNAMTNSHQPVSL